MFFQNWASPNLEYKKFLAFNNTGGRCWEKMSHVERQSALTLWKQTPEQKPHLGAEFLAFWQEVYNRLRSLDAPLELRMDALADSIGWDARNNMLTLHCSDRLREYIERNMTAFKPLIRTFQRLKNLSPDIQYIIIPPVQQRE